MDLASFERYRSLVDDWDAFAEYQDRPLRPTAWTNTLRTTPEEVHRYLALDGLDAEPLSWLPEGFRLPLHSQPGKNLGRLLGLFQIQEEVSMMPIHILDPQPGERILDLCAAPGNKTVQAAVRMENRGTVIANDLNHHRLGLAYSSIERLGVTNAALYHQDAGNLPRSLGLYDRVLADVPCSCEGTIRRHPEILLRPWRPGFRQNSQIAILRKAVQLCRPGGRVVYSTCTYAPEENEQVVDAVLRNPPTGTRIRLLGARIEGLTTSPGVTEWKGKAFNPSMSSAMRIYPHQNDTGGFFIALIERLDVACDGDKGGYRRFEPKDAKTVTPSDIAAVIDPEAYLADMEKRFGIPRQVVMENDLVFQSSTKRASMASRQMVLPYKLKTWALGMPFFSTKRRHPRIASAMVRRLGRYVTRNLVDLDEEQMEELLVHREIALRCDQETRLDGEGYVVPRFRGFVATVARYRRGEDGGPGVIRGVIPKLWSQALDENGFEP